MIIFNYIGIGLIILGFGGTFLCHKTQTFEQFSGVWNRCIICGTLILFINLLSYIR